MLTDDEQRFIKFWEENREAHSSFTSKLLRGLPMASVFGLPILLLVLSVYLFLPEWYYRISKTSGSTFTIVVLAVSIAVVFYAFIRMHFKWEMNEQLFKELKYKEGKQSSELN